MKYWDKSMKATGQYSCQHSHLPLAKLLHAPDFIAAHRTHDKAFTRQRVLTFPVLVSFLLCAFKGSLQTQALRSVFLINRWLVADGEQKRGLASPAKTQVQCVGSAQRQLGRFA
ncbi:MAG: hypothetical protein ACRER2_04765, partial [Methylococcales bacterium]